MNPALEHGTTRFAASMAKKYKHKKCAEKCQRHFATNQFLSHESEAEGQMKKSSRNPSQPSKRPRRAQNTSDLWKNTVVVKKIRDSSFQCERVCTQSHVETATITHTRFHTIEGILGHGLGNTLCSSLFRGGLICNIVVVLTVIYSVLQRGTDIRDSDVRRTRLSQRHQQFCSTL